MILKKGGSVRFFAGMEPNQRLLEMNQKKEAFEAVEIEIVEFSADDVIRTSNGNDFEDEDQLPDDEF